MEEGLEGWIVLECNTIKARNKHFFFACFSFTTLPL